MNPQSSKGPTDYNQPVAYDTNGQPLYAHPPSMTPETPPVISEPVANPNVKVAQASDVTARHVESKQQYPQLNLSQDEYVVEEIRRHLIGLLPILAMVGFVVLAGILVLLFYPMIAHSAAGTLPTPSSIILPVLMIIILVVLLGYIAYTIYISNKLFLTDESVIDETQGGLFAHQERTVSLANIEEVTFSQNSVLQNWFNYGTLRMTIEGDHVAYEFPYMGNPKSRVDMIVNAIEQFKFHRHSPNVTE